MDDRDVQGRVSHAAQAIRQLDIVRRAIGRCCPLALQRVMRARGLLDNYACRRTAPWLEPAPVLYPFVDAMIEGRSGLVTTGAIDEHKPATPQRKLQSESDSGSHLDRRRSRA